MNALILAAGYGLRLRRVLKNIPKCLVQVEKNKTILDMWITKLLSSGIKKIFINTHYKSLLVKKIISKKYSSNVKILHEEKLLGTSKTILKNKNLISNSDCIILHVDNFAPNINLKSIINFFYKRPKESHVVLVGFKTDDYKNTGILKINKFNKLLKVNEKLNFKTGNLANGAIYILSRQAIKKFKKIKYNNLILDICEKFHNQIYVYKYNGIYFDIGTIKNYKKLKKFCQLMLSKLKARK